ncbi:MAG: acyl-CoA-binding protein [Rhodanobacteraceae bacterium]
MPSDLDAEFRKAAEDVRHLPTRPDNDTLLKLYALYKQATAGNNDAPKPGFFDFVGTAKYEAWSRLRGMQAADAQQKYIELVRALEAKA